MNGECTCYIAQITFVVPTGAGDARKRAVNGTDLELADDGTVKAPEHPAMPHKNFAF